MSQPESSIAPDDVSSILRDEEQSPISLISAPVNSAIFLTIGFAIWLLATLAIRNFGELIFKANEPILALGLYLFTAVALIFLARAIFAWQKLDQSDYFKAAILLVVPGMILDSVVMVSFGMVFPNLVPSSDSAIASWLLWSYAFVLLSGFIKKGDV